MSEEFESPVEHLEDELREAAEHAKENWLKWSALLSALFAVCAAITGLQSSHDESTAMLEQIQSSDQWNYYQAKGIKANLVQSEADTLEKLGKPENKTLADKLAKYKTEQEQIKQAADKLAETSGAHLERHEVLSRAVTLFQVAIAVIAIAVMTKRRAFVLVAVGLGAIGLFFMAQGLLMGA